EDHASRSGLIQPDQRPADGRFSADRLADQSQGFPFVYVKGDIIHRFDHLVSAGIKIFLQVFHFQNLFRSCRHLEMPPPTASFSTGAYGCSNQRESWCVSNRTVTSVTLSSHIFLAYGHRSATVHPFGGASRSGGFPGMVSSSSSTRSIRG